MQDNPAVLCHIKDYELALNKIVVDTKRDLDAFRQKSSNWCDELKTKLKKEYASKRRDYNVPSAVPSKVSGREWLTHGGSVNLNVINIAESHIHIGNESISCRTRGALKALQNSVVGGSIGANQTETQKTRGRSRVRRTKQDDIIKRSAEEDTLGVDLISKKIKKEKLSMIETPKKSEEFFKKPKPRGRKPKKEKQSELLKNVSTDMGVEESITFNAVLHSSPNGNIGENTFLLSPKNLSVIPKSQVVLQNLPQVKENDQRTTPQSNVNNFISDGERGNLKLSKHLMIETDIGQNQNNEIIIRRSSRLSKELTKDLNEISKIKSPKSDVIVNNQQIDKIAVRSSVSNDLANNVKNSELPDNENNVKETDKINEMLEKKSDGNIIGGDDDIIDSSISGSAGGGRKPCSNRVKSDKIIRETRSGKSGCEIQSSIIKSTTEIDEDAVSSQELNSTKVVPKATKRTKPVLKSRIFDSKGNILPSVVTEKNFVNTNTPEKPYSVRSSFTREIIVKKEIVDSLDVNEENRLVETNEIHERRSNVENEPKAIKTKRTKTKKTKAPVDGKDDPGRITRTKSKKAKEALEEAAAKKTGLIEFARKSLNKAKLISLQKDQPKIKQPLTNLLSSQKRQKSLSKLHAGLKDDILGSSNKLNTIPIKNSIVNLGSQVKMSKVNCLKNNENLLTGKGKYQNLLTDTKEKYITPLKRCLSPDFSVKSTSKTTREEEIEKEMKLRALKEKEEEALLKREMTIKMRQKELKEKNEKKLELATQQRKKIEMEKYYSKIQLEKEKEEKRKLILQEREIKKKEKAMMKKKLMEQKLAETEERRRIEEEARIAKLKEQEAEQQRLMIEKQKELERHEKRAQERLAEQKARENYEMKLKTEQLLREKQQQLFAAQLQSANKATTTKGYPVKKKWNYKPRNENDLGLDDEESDVDSEKEGSKPDKSRPVPKWAERVMSKQGIVKCFIKKEAMMEFMVCHQKTPDIQKMFKMTPTKRIKRTSSAIWNTPSS